MGSNQDRLEVNEKPDCKFEKEKLKLKLTTVLNLKVHMANIKELLKIRKLKL